MTIQKLFFYCFGKSITKPVLQSCNASLYVKLEKGSFFLDFANYSYSKVPLKLYYQIALT